MKFRIVWNCLIICNLFARNMCLVNDTIWKREDNFRQYVCAGETNIKTTAKSLMNCGTICSSHPRCLSFTYVQDRHLNCLMHTEDVYNEMFSDSCIYDSNAKHYIKISTTFNCHQADDRFRTILLPSGELFCYKVVESATTGILAKSICESQGGFLAKVSTLPKLHYLHRLLTSCSAFKGSMYFIGGSNANALDFLSSNAWTWHDGEPVNMSSKFWVPGTPNHPLTENCMFMNIPDGLVDDIPCLWAREYICERSV